MYKSLIFTFVGVWSKNNANTNNTWLDASDVDDGFEQKRQRVSDAFVAPVDPAPAPNAGPVDTWTTATSQNVVQKQASEHLSKGHATSTDIQNLQWNSTAPATKVVAWEQNTVQDNNSLPSASNWENVQNISKISNETTPTIVPTSGWTFSEKVENSVTSSVNLSENSNDSGKCTKWESINYVKPLEPWNNNTTNNLNSDAPQAIINNSSNTVNPYIELSTEHLTKGHATSSDIQGLQWNNSAAATKDVNNQTWTVTSEPVSSVSEPFTSPADSTWNAAAAVETKAWTNAAEQVMDSVTSGLSATGVVAAEMIAVNPKEVSPMDVDDIHGSLMRVPTEHLTKSHATSSDIQTLQWNNTAPANKVVAWEQNTVQENNSTKVPTTSAASNNTLQLQNTALFVATTTINTAVVASLTNTPATVNTLNQQGSVQDIIIPIPRASNSFT